MRECISRKMEHHHILSFLIVHSLTAILLIGGLGVEDQPCGLPQVPILLREIYFCGAAPKETCPDRNQDRRTNCNSKFEPFAAVSLYLLRNVWTLSVRLQNRVQNSGA
jgi:hypothetical protein